MRAHELTAVKRHGADLALADRQLDAAPGEAGVQGVVVRVKAEVGLLGHPKDAAKRRSVSGIGVGQRAHALPLSREALGGNGADAAVKAGVGALG